MLKQQTLVLAVVLLFNVCISSLASAALRSGSENGGESSELRPPRRPRTHREDPSFLQLSFGLRAVAEAQAEMADSQEQPSPSSASSLSSSAALDPNAEADSSSAVEARESERLLAASVGPLHGMMLLDAATGAADQGNSSVKLEVARDSDSQGGGLVVFLLGFLLGAVVCGLLPILGYAVARALGKRIERGVAVSDQAFLGVDIDIGKISVHLWEGYIVVHGFTVFNPPGYSAEYLLKAEAVNVDIRMATLVCSCFRTVQVEKVVFSGVDMLYDKSWSSSNINDVINFTRGGGTTVEKSEQNPENCATCTMRKVFFEDVIVRQPAAGKVSLALSAADLDVQDFSAEVGESRLHFAAFELLRRVLKTAAANLEHHAAVAGPAGKQ